MGRCMIELFLTWFFGDPHAFPVVPEATNTLASTGASRPLLWLVVATRTADTVCARSDPWCTWLAPSIQENAAYLYNKRLERDENIACYIIMIDNISYPLVTLCSDVRAWGKFAPPPHLKCVVCKHLWIWHIFKRFFNSKGAHFHICPHKYAPHFPQTKSGAGAATDPFALLFFPVHDYGSGMGRGSIIVIWQSVTIGVTHLNSC